MERTRRAAVFSLAGLLVNGALADGYRNPPPTAEGIGKSGANMVFSGDASAISYNPANLALQQEASLVVAATFARTENTYSPAPGVSFESDGDWNILPNLYYAQPLGDSGLALGLGINTPYGQGLSWKKDDFAPFVAADPAPYDASIMLININPTIAFRLGESVLLGVGADLFYSELELKALFPTRAPPPAPPEDTKAEGDGWGFGGNLGLTWLPTESQRVAFTYRSRVDVEYKGDFSAPFPNNGGFETTVKYPNILGLGYGIEVAKGVQVEAMAEWLEWSVNDTQTLKAGGGVESIENKWDDTFTFGVGASWRFAENWVLRAGYAFIESPIPDGTITPLLPDADRHALSLGLGCAFGGHAIDVAYTYSIYEDRTSPAGSAAPGTYDLDSNLFGMAYSLSF